MCFRHRDLPDYYIYFEIRYCGHPAFPYAHIQLEQATKLILSHFQEEYHLFVYDNLNNKDTQLVCLYFVYRPKKNVSITDLTNDDQKYFVFAPIYGDESNAFHSHMLYYSNTLQSMLLDYTVTEMGCFDDYSDAATCAKTMRGNGITNFILHVSQCITFNKIIVFTATIIAKERLKS